LRQFLAPRFWPTWLGLGFMWLLTRLPFGVQMRIGQGLGWLSFHLARARREVTRINLELCFPELSPQQRRRLLKDTFLANGMGIMEVALAWNRKLESFRPRVSITGLQHLRDARAQGRGVLLIGAHFSTLELGGSLLSLFEPMDVTYRRHKNPLFDAVMTNGRKRLFPAVIERENVRDAIRSLKQGHVLWYAPDQDYGPRRAVFVPFFGVPAATITATSRFAAVNQSVVLFFSHHRIDNNTRYHLDISAPLPGYPSGDDVADAITMNRLIEQAVRRHPEQYLWMHKRFKTQAEGPSGRLYQSGGPPTGGAAHGGAIDDSNDIENP
jgi:KDO2-lipid IV(A) lauroyltransferase